MTPPSTVSPSKPQKEANTGRPQPNWLGPLVLLGPGSIWLLLLLVLPSLVIFELSLVPEIQPGEVVNPSGLDNYCRALGFEKCVWSNFDPVYLQVIWRSLLLAIGTTATTLLLGFPVAYWLALSAPKKWQNLLLVSFILPLWTSSLLRSYAWRTILRPTGVVNSLLTSLGLPALDLLHQSSAVLIGMSYGFLPYMVLILYSSLEKLDKRLLEAAADLGANPIEVFWKVTVPQTFPGIAAGSLLVFISTLGDFVDPELLGGASSMTISRLIYDQFLGSARDWGFGSALSMLLIMAVSIAIALLIRFGEGAPKR